MDYLDPIQVLIMEEEGQCIPHLRPRHIIPTTGWTIRTDQQRRRRTEVSIQTHTQEDHFIHRHDPRMAEDRIQTTIWWTDGQDLISTFPPSISINFGGWCHTAIIGCWCPKLRAAHTNLLTRKPEETKLSNLFLPASRQRQPFPSHFSFPAPPFVPSFPQQKSYHLPPHFAICEKRWDLVIL